jgi:hypothetical protein
MTIHILLTITAIRNQESRESTRLRLPHPRHRRFANPESRIQSAEDRDPILLVHVPSLLAVSRGFEYFDSPFVVRR